MAPSRRKAAASLGGDAKLQRVMHALDVATRSGALFVSGSCQQFPFPGIAFKDDEDELLPLRRDDAQKIKARARVTNVDTQDARSVWEVDGDALESHNKRWLTFLEDRVTSMRQLLAIPPMAVVNVSLKKLILVEAGGSICTQRGDEEPAAGVFATLLVVLPGAFEHGDFSSKTMRWRPSARGSDYDMTYAVFYNHYMYTAEPVTDGAALCLVYNLATPTPSDIPLFVGVQRSIDAGLTDFFDVIPESLVKRCKISDDAWRTVNEFVAERQFAYRVPNDSFEDLHGDNMTIAERLASFCAHSGGRYVLYLAGVLYSRVQQSPHCYNRHGYLVTNPREWSVTLKAPWIKHGDLEEIQCPPIFLRPHDEIAPFKYLNEGHWHNINNAPAGAKAIAKTLHGDNAIVDAYWTNALVVLPASVEARQMAKLPIRDAVGRLRGLLAESRVDALQYARRIVDYHPAWHVRFHDMDPFTEFVRIVVEINDRQLFNDLLLAVDLERSGHQSALSLAVKHFGWPACADAVVKRLLSTKSAHSRINWVPSVFYEGMDSSQIDSIFRVLVSLYPWTDAMVDPNEAFNDTACDKQIDNFKRLFAIANRSSPQRLIQIASVRREVTLLHVVVPAAVDFVEEHDAAPPLRSLLLYAWKVYQPILVRLRNELHEKIRLPTHCATCDQLQYFLSSSDIETTIAFTSLHHRRHIEVVVSTAVAYQREARVYIRNAGETAVRLTKERRSSANPSGLYPFAQMWNDRMLALISRYSDQASEDSQ